MNLTEYRALTFDCYGTLIDWERGILEVLRAWAERHGVTSSGPQLLETYGSVEVRLQQAEPTKRYRELLYEVQLELADHFNVSRDPSDAKAFSDSIHDWPPFPDSPAALAYLKLHYRLVILSNVDRRSFRSSNEKLGVEFDLIVTAEDVGSYKPNPGHFIEAFGRLKAMGIGKDQILHLAQSLYHDIRPANALGLACVWVNRRHDRPDARGIEPPADARPDLVVTSLAEFAERHRQAIGG
ncbi:MAG: haloacid dehalogenase type II [Alphaproteobacteria bacterium]